jgi:hypothetical protein
LGAADLRLSLKADIAAAAIRTALLSYRTFANFALQNKAGPRLILRRRRFAVESGASGKNPSTGGWFASVAKGTAGLLIHPPKLQQRRMRARVTGFRGRE